MFIKLWYILEMTVWNLFPQENHINLDTRTYDLCAKIREYTYQMFEKS